MSCIGAGPATHFVGNWASRESFLHAEPSSLHFEVITQKTCVLSAPTMDENSRTRQHRAHRVAVPLQHMREVGNSGKLVCVGCAGDHY